MGAGKGRGRRMRASEDNQPPLKKVCSPAGLGLGSGGVGGEVWVVLGEPDPNFTDESPHAADGGRHGAASGPPPHLGGSPRSTSYHIPQEAGFQKSQGAKIRPRDERKINSPPWGLRSK